MKRHWVTVHGHRGLENKHWRAVNLQVFIRGNNIRYFIVTPKEQGCERQDLNTASEEARSEAIDRLTSFDLGHRHDVDESVS